MTTLTKPLAIACVLLTSSAFAADWTQWRGPSRDGQAAQKLPDQPKLSKLWSRDIGIGFSAVSVKGDRLIAMGNQKGKEIVQCLDANTGKTLWQISYPCELLPRMHEGGPGSTPTIDGETVYTLSKEGQIHALSLADGKILWQHKLQEKLSLGLPDWGYAGSPLILGDLVILDVGPTVALNKKTGELVWRSKNYTPAYGSPILFPFRGRNLIATLNSEMLVVLDASTGAEIAGTPWKTQYDAGAGTPLALPGDRLFVSTGYAKGCGVFQFDGSKLTEVYLSKDLANHMNGSVLIDGKLYGFHGQGHPGERKRAELVCMDASTGKVLWAQKGLGCGSLSAAGDMLVLLSDRGELVLSKAKATNFAPLARMQAVGEAEGRGVTAWTSPTIAHDRIYCRNAAGELACIEVK